MNNPFDILKAQSEFLVGQLHKQEATTHALIMQDHVQGEADDAQRADDEQFDDEDDE